MTALYNAEKTGGPPPASNVYAGKWTLRSGYALTILTLIYAFNYLDRQVLSLVLPLIKKDLHLSDMTLGLISGFVFVIFYTFLGIPIARIADRSNRRNILAVGLAFWSVMTALTGAVTTGWQLAVTRFLMGAGEATGVAPSTSIISNMFDKTRRPLAMSILTSGSAISSLAFFPIAGWTSQHYGWRVTFLMAGIPGMFLALLLFFTIKEPGRTKKAILQEKFSATMHFLFSSPAFVFTVLGGALVGIDLYAQIVWSPSFLARVHHLNQTQIGYNIGIFHGLAGLIGALLGGFLAERLGKINERWRLWVPGLACIMTLPATLLYLFGPTLNLSLIGLGLSSAFLTMHMGPVYAACHSVAKPAMRATATATFLFAANLIGQIIGPLVVGYLNDHWRQTYGDEAIRYSLVVGAVSVGLGGILMMIGSIRLPQDSARAEL